MRVALGIRATPGEDMRMANSDEATAAPLMATNRGSQKMLQLLRKRLRQLLWITAGLAILLALISGIFGIWWLKSLNGLPDIGDPFDVAELNRFQIPDDQNAFTYLRLADQKLTPLSDLQTVQATASKVGWSKADPKLRTGRRQIVPCLPCFKRRPIKLTVSHIPSVKVSRLSTDM